MFSVIDQKCMPLLLLSQRAAADKC